MREEKLKQPKLLEGTFREFMKNVNTAIPGHVLTFEPSTQLAQIQIGVQRVDLTGATFSLPPIIEVPVQFPGDGATLEFRVSAGCEGLVVFSQRCIDGWLQSGGVAPNPIGRFHDRQDALFLPGTRSKSNAISGFANNGIRIRNEAGDVYVWIKDDKSIAIDNGVGHFVMQPNGAVLINGATITTDGDVVTASGISLAKHRTSGVTAGNAISGVPVI